MPHSAKCKLCLAKTSIQEYIDKQYFSRASIRINKKARQNCFTLLVIEQIRNIMWILVFQTGAQTDTYLSNIITKLLRSIY
jgi:hypothetical protein